VVLLLLPFLRSYIALVVVVWVTSVQAVLAKQKFWMKRSVRDFTMKRESIPPVVAVQQT
jgi:hypothetical protein